MKPLSLGCQLFLTVALFTAGTFGTEAYNGILMQQEREAGAYRDAGTVLEILSSEVTRMVGGTRNLLIGLVAEAPYATDPNGCRRLDAALKGRFVGRINLWILDSAGNATCSAPRGAALPPEGALAARATSVSSGPVTGAMAPASEGRGPSLAIAHPWSGTDGSSGAVVAMIDLKWIEDVYRNRPLPIFAAVAIVGPAGTVLASNSTAGGPGSVTDLPSEGAAVEWSDGVPRLTKAFHNAAGIPGLSGVVGIDRDAVLAPYAKARMRMLLTAAGTLLACGFVAAAVVNRSVARPIRDLIRATDRLAVGGRGGRVSPAGAREIRSLADSFNRMAACLDEAESDQNRARARAEETNRSKSRFLAATSHDLRQPLQAAAMFASGLATQVAGTKAAGPCASLQVSLETLRSLLDNILDASRLETGTVQANLEILALGPLLEEVQASFEPFALAKGISLFVLPSADSVLSDRILLGRMIRNLVENAIRYTDQGRVMVECYPGQSGRLTLDVRDTGIGIPEGEQGTIWEEFKQLRNPARERTNGIGLGLSIVSRLSKVLDHPVSLESKEGRGSCFSLSIPFAEAPAEAREPSPGFRQNAGIPAGSRILIIEDNESVACGIECVLGAWQAECMICHNGGAAAAAALEFVPDAVLSDFRLPDMTGVEAVKSVRAALGRDVPAVILTGEIGGEPEREAEPIGVEVLRKPIGAAGLAKAIRGLLAVA